MSLSQYHAKRDFDATPEPKGQTGPDGESAPRFVVQLHRARRQHYDFRLEVAGVLASWAVPKGPTLDPAVRSLAVHVEDHPLEYRDFEGVIPSGQYGGGDVIVWDRGTWELFGAGPAEDAIQKGEIHFDLFGEKLRGRFVLVRTARPGDRQEQWLLLHKHDDQAVPGWNPRDYPRSVKSGRTNDEVAADPDAMWRSDLPADEAEVPVGPPVTPAGSRPGSRSSPTPTPGSSPTSGSSATRGATSSPTPTPGSRSSATPGSSTTSGSGPSTTSWPSATSGRWDPPTDAELAALDAMGSSGPWELQGGELRLTNLDKVLFPARDGEEPVTKRDLVRYYATTAPVMLPYLVDRPVNLNRFPNGSDRPGFWHKEVPKHAPDWLRRWRNENADSGESQWYFVVDSPRALAWMGNYGAIELHPWTSRVEDVRQPTYAFIDIDPGTSTTFADVVLLARLFRTGLDHLGVFGLPKLTGRRGIHIWIPISPGYSFEDTRKWTEQLSRAVAATVPELVSWEWEKTRRRGLARLDYTQNARNKTLVAPYSARPAPGAPVSVPIEWDELDDPNLASDMWTIRSLPARLAATGDRFYPLIGYEQQLPKL